MPNNIKEALERHRQTNQPAAVRLAFVIGFLSGSLEAKRAHRRGQKKFLEWCLECNEESKVMIAEFDEELAASLNVSRESQHN